MEKKSTTRKSRLENFGFLSDINLIANKEASQSDFNSILIEDFIDSRNSRKVSGIHTFSAALYDIEREIFPIFP